MANLYPLCPILRTTDSKQDSRGWRLISQDLGSKLRALLRGSFPSPGRQWLLFKGTDHHCCKPISVIPGGACGEALGDAMWPDARGHAGALTAPWHTPCSGGQMGCWSSPSGPQPVSSQSETEHTPSGLFFLTSGTICTDCSFPR